MNVLTSDLSMITDIPKLTLDKLLNIAAQSISSTFYDAIKNKESTCSIDIGIGRLYIKADNDTIKYKFIPSKELDNLNMRVITAHENPLVVAVDSSLKDKILNTYRGLL